MVLRAAESNRVAAVVKSASGRRLQFRGASSHCHRGHRGSGGQGRGTLMTYRYVCLLPPASAASSEYTGSAGRGRLHSQGDRGAAQCTGQVARVQPKLEHRRRGGSGEGGGEGGTSWPHPSCPPAAAAATAAGRERRSAARRGTCERSGETEWRAWAEKKTPCTTCSARVVWPRPAPPGGWARGCTQQHWQPSVATEAACAVSHCTHEPILTWICECIQCRPEPTLQKRASFWRSCTRAFSTWRSWRHRGEARVQLKSRTAS